MKTLRRGRLIPRTIMSIIVCCISRADQALSFEHVVDAFSSGMDGAKAGHCLEVNDRAPLELHEPDNSDTFVSSPV